MFTWRCAVRQRHANHVSITARWSRHSRSTPMFISCPILVGSLLQNSDQSSVVILHTSYYSTIGQSFFTKVDDYTPFKLRQLLKCHPLSSKRHIYVSPNIYHWQMTIDKFRSPAKTLYFLSFLLSLERAEVLLSPCTRGDSEIGIICITQYTLHSLKFSVPSRHYFMILQFSQTRMFQVCNVILAKPCAACLHTIQVVAVVIRTFKSVIAVGLGGIRIRSFIQEDPTKNCTK